MTGTCLHCNEPHDNPEEATMPVNGGAAWMHQSCLLRMVAGGVNHQRGSCFCCGGPDDPDPPSLTTREAARVAFKYYRLHRKADAV